LTFETCLHDGVTDAIAADRILVAARSEMLSAVRRTKAKKM